MQESERLVWLPDENRSVSTETGMGPVRSRGENRLPRDAARAMHAGSAGGVRSSWLQLEQRTMDGPDDAWKGFMTMVLLWDILDMDADMRIVRLDASQGRLTANVLKQLELPYLEICLLEKNGQKCLLGIPDEDMLLVPAQQPGDFRPFTCGRIPWFQENEGKFVSPLPYLDDRQRQILTGRLRSGPFFRAARQFADEIDADWEQKRLSALQNGKWKNALECAVCLQGETGFELLSEHREAGHAMGRHPLLEALGLLEPVVYLEEKCTWTYRGVCFAQSDSACGILPVDDTEAESVMHSLAEEEEILIQHSPEYAFHAQQRLADFVREREGLRENVRERIGKCTQHMQERAASPVLESVFSYPWREDSPALKRILDEKIGGTLGQALMRPFSDRLTLMDGAFMGPEDQTLMLEGFPWKVLPPLSETLAEWTAVYGWTGSGVQPASFGYEGDDKGSVCVTLRFRGSKGAVTLKRSYASMEQVRLGEEQIPEISIWPSVPVERGRWQAYYMSVRGRGEACVFDGGALKTCGREDVDDFSRCHVTSTGDYPNVILFRRNHLTLGALLNQPQVFHPDDFGTAIGAIDAGDAGCAMAMTMNGMTAGLNMPSLWQVCLRGSRQDMEGEALPTLPLEQVVETAVVLNQVRMQPEPFTDGWLCFGAGPERERPLRHFFRRDDREAMAARGVLLRQVFLMMSLHAVMNSHSAVEWRITCPAGMSDGDRKKLEAEVRQAAEAVSALCGVPCTGISLVRDMLCVERYLYESSQRSSFLVVNAGSSETGAGIWLRGRPRPVLETGLGYGFVTRALMALIQNPEMAEHDLFGLDGFPTEAFLLNLARSQTEVEAGEQALADLDLLFGPGLDRTAQHMNQAFLSGNMTGIQAVLLLYLAETLTLAGVCLEKVYQSSLLSDALPAEMPLVLCGRGAWVYMALDPTMRYQLMRFLRLPMSRTHPVQQVQLVMSKAPKMEAAIGLAGMQETEESIPMLRDCSSAVSMDALVGHFLMLFQAALPQACALLFPDRFGPGGLLQESTFAGIEDLCSGISGKSFAEGFLQVVETLRIKRPFLKTLDVELHGSGAEEEQKA